MGAAPVLVGGEAVVRDPLPKGPMRTWLFSLSHAWLAGTWRSCQREPRQNVQVFRRKHLRVLCNQVLATRCCPVYRLAFSVLWRGSLWKGLGHIAMQRFCAYAGVRVCLCRAAGAGAKEVPFRC